MTNFAIIQNNTVTNVIVADTKEIALEVTNAEEVLETTGEPWLHWTRTDGVWSAPIVEEVVND